MDNQKTGVHGPELSIFGLPKNPELFAKALEDRLASDTKRVDDALVAVLQEELLLLLNSWFGRKPDEFDQGLMKRLTNALLSAGKSGEDRTLASLQTISNSTWERHVNKVTSDNAAEQLREKTADFRRASAFVDHQAKCVKAFLKVITEKPVVKSDTLMELLIGDLDSATEIFDWSSVLSMHWYETTNIDPKNRSMYQKYWREFISVVSSAENGDYGDFLSTKAQNYLSESNQDLFKKSYRRLKDSARKADSVDLAPKSSLKLDSGNASLSTTFSMSSGQVHQMKEDLLFMFASDVLLQTQQLEILIDPNDEQTLVVKFTPPKEMLTYRRVIQALNGNIEKAYSQISR